MDSFSFDRVSGEIFYGTAPISTVMAQAIADSLRSELAAKCREPATDQGPWAAADLVAMMKVRFEICGVLRQQRQHRQAKGE